MTVSMNDLATFGQSQPQDDSTTQGINTIEFPNATAGITLNLGEESTGPVPEQQQVTSDISLAVTGTSWNVVGTQFADDITGGSGTTTIDGNGGQDTLVGGTGSTTLYAGAGNDSLVAGTGGTTFVFNRSSQGTDTISTPNPTGTNTLDFSAFGSGVTINLASTALQTAVGTGLSLTLQNPSGINAVVDSAYNDRVIGNTAGDSFYLGSGSDSITGGGGQDSFYFQGTQFGNDTINESSTGNALNFYNFGQGIDLSLQQSEAGVAQTLEPGSANSPTLTLSDPSAFGTVVGTPYADTIVGNAATDETIIGGGGEDSLQAGNGNDYLQGDVTQVVYLDFPTPDQADPDEHIYTPLEEAAIQQGLEADYADYNFFFTQNQSTAQQVAATTGGQYVTEIIDAPVVGGSADELDTDNLSLGGTAEVNVSPFLGSESAGLVPPTSANIIGLTTTIAAHELGHLVGLQHQDALGPIGTGIDSGINPDSFYPAYPAYPTSTAISSFVSSAGVTFTATVTADNPSDGVPTGTVDFYDLTTNTDLTPGGVSVAQGGAFVTPSQTIAVGDVIVATFTSSSGYTSSSASETVDSIATTTSVTVSTSYSYTYYEVLPTLTATVSAANEAEVPGGAVEFFDGNTSLGTASISYGTATLVLSPSQQPPAPGDLITAVYSGSGNFAGSSSGQAVIPSATNLYVYSEGTGPYSYYQVDVSSAAGGTPTGTIDFYDATTKTDLTATPLTLSGGGAYIYVSSFNAQPNGGDVILVTYTSNSSSFLNSASSLSVLSGTTTTLTVAGSQLTATVSASRRVDSDRHGEFLRHNDKHFSGERQLFDGVATLPLNAPLTVGDVITATYQGGSGFVGSSNSATVPNPSASTIVVYAYADYGYFYVSLTGANGQAPTGSLDFYDETTNTDLTPTPVSVDGYAYVDTYQLAQLPSAGDSILITYTSNNSFQSSSTTVTFEPFDYYTYGQGSSGTASTTTSLSLSTSYVVATVEVPATDSDVTNGSIDFYDATTQTDLTPGGMSASDGGATLYFFDLPANEQPAIGDVITASYSGSSSFTASGAGVTIPKSSSTTSLSSIIASNGQSIVLTAAVSGSDETPTGSVDFYDETTNTDLGSSTVLYDSAIGEFDASIPAKPASGDSIIATYSGDSNYAASASGLTVSPVKTTTSVNYSASSNGENVVVTATVITANGSTPAGAVNFYDATTGKYLAQNVELVDGSASLPVSPAVGDVITATFSSGSNGYFASSSAGQPIAMIGTTTSLAGTLELTATVSSPNGGSVDFYDETTGTDLTPGGVPLTGNSASTSVSLALAGDNIVAIYSDENGAVSTPTLTQCFVLTASVSASSGMTPAGAVDFYDATTGKDLTPGGVSLVNGSAGTMLALTLAGHDIIATYSGSPYILQSNASQTLGSDAYETVHDIMASPDAVGSTLLDAAAQRTWASAMRLPWPSMTPAPCNRSRICQLSPG